MVGEAVRDTPGGLERFRSAVRDQRSDQETAVDVTNDNAEQTHPIMLVGYGYRARPSGMEAAILGQLAAQDQKSGRRVYESAKYGCLLRAGEVIDGRKTIDSTLDRVSGSHVVGSPSRRSSSMSHRASATSTLTEAIHAIDRRIQLKGREGLGA